MDFEPWMLAAIDEAGYNGITEEHLDLVVAEIERSYSGTIGKAEFRRACQRCGIDPDNFTQEDIERLNEKLE